MNQFTCSRCGKTKTNKDKHTTGYATDNKGNKICFSCCANVDKEQMIKSGKIVLYLNSRDKVVSNWPGTLKIKVDTINKGKHNIAGNRNDIYFSFNGKKWHGVQLGNNSDICRCKQLK